MRTVSEIVGAVQDQEHATEEELRLTLLCLFYHGQLHSAPDHEDADPMLLRARVGGEFEARFRLMKSRPDKYLGDRWTPGTKANTEGRRVSEAIARKAGVL